MLLYKDSTFKFKDYSVPKDDPVHNANNAEALREAIRAQIAHASCVLVLAGVYANYSKWIDIEIDLAKNGFDSPKPIIAVEPWSAEKTSTIQGVWKLWDLYDPMTSVNPFKSGNNAIIYVRYVPVC